MISKVLYYIYRSEDLEKYINFKGNWSYFIWKASKLNIIDAMFNKSFILHNDVNIIGEVHIYVTSKPRAKGRTNSSGKWGKLVFGLAPEERISINRADMFPVDSCAIPRSVVFRALRTEG